MMLIKCGKNREIRRNISSINHEAVSGNEQQILHYLFSCLNADFNEGGLL